VRDTVSIENAGTPCVGLVHVPFETIGRSHAARLGMADAPLLIYPQDLPSQDQRADVEAKARRVAEALAPMLLSRVTAPTVIR
jgi:hypothetical protein